jgi:hypothetical protein
VAAWFTEYFDEFYQQKREEIEVFFDDYLNPDTVGYFSIPCDAQIRADFTTEEFLFFRDLWDNEIIHSALLPEHISELVFYSITTHGILDWLAQHFGFIDTAFPTYFPQEQRIRYSASNWHNGYGVYNIPGDERLYFTLSQKRAVLKNAYNFDQNLNSTGELYKYPFNNFPEQNLWSPANWRGINFAKGSIQVLNFIFDVLGLHGTAPRLPIIETGGGNQSYNWENQPQNWNELTQQWEVAGQSSTSQPELVSDQLTAYLTPSPDDYIIPLRPFVKSDCMVSVSPYPSFSENLAITGYCYTRTPGSDRAIYRVPLYWERNGNKWRLLEEAIEIYGDTSVLVGYNWFLPNKSLPGDPVFNYNQYEGAKLEIFGNLDQYEYVDFFSVIVNVKTLFDPQFEANISIFPPKNTIFKYLISGNNFRASIPNDGNWYRYSNKSNEIVKIVFENPRTLRKFTRWVKVP